MPTNVEVKAKIRDPARLALMLSQLSDGPRQVLAQEDVFFRVSEGRLKLRHISGLPSELIYYQREDRKTPTDSQYWIHRVEQPDPLQEILTVALGVLGRVRKQRTLYSIGQTRIHLDQVEGLGNFVELEVLLGEGQPPEEGRKIASILMDRLEIRDGDLVSGAYLDLLASKED